MNATLESRFQNNFIDFFKRKHLEMALSQHSDFIISHTSINKCWNVICNINTVKANV